MSNHPSTWKAVQVPYESVMSKSEEVICVGLTEQQIAALLSQTAYLHWPTRWSSEAPFTDEQIAGIKRLAQETEAALLTACGETACYDLPPSSGMVTWEPQNPYTEPSLIPDGYADVPFTVVKSSDVGLLALGLAVGDVMTDITRFPTGSLPTVIPPGGFARFRVTFTGNEIELHLLQIPFGGMATISVDGDVTSLQTIDLSKDVFSLPVETISVITHQIKFAAIDEHYVDVTFVPWVNDEVPFLSYGGGIRAFTVCGEYQDVFDVRQNPDLPCKLEKSLDNGETWTEFADLQKCIPRMRRNPGTGAWELSGDGLTWFAVEDGPWTEGYGEPPPTPAPRPRTESTDISQRCAAAANAENVIHSTFNGTSDYISVTNNTPTDVALGVGGILGALLFVPGPWWLFLVPVIVALIAAAVVFNRSDYDGEVAERLRCILYCNSTGDNGTITFDFEAVKADVNAEIGLPWPALSYVLDMIGADGLNVAGGTTAVSDPGCDCPDCDDTWCVTFDFSEGMLNWNVVPLTGFTPAYLGEYSSGAWQKTYVTTNGSGSPPLYTFGVFIRRPLIAPTVITEISMTYDYAWGNSSGVGQQRRSTILGLNGGAGVVDYEGLIGSESSGSGKVRTWTGEQEMTEIQLRVDSDYFRGTSGQWTTGTARIHSVTICGKGENPFEE